MKQHDFYYVPPENIDKNTVTFSGAELKHLKVVKRKRVGNIVQVVDGAGGAYTVELTQIDAKKAEGKIHKKTRYLGEPNFQLTLAQAIPKGNRFDLIIEKCTEIGVSHFIPLITDRTIPSAGEAKLKRWQKVAVAAMKQCARSVLPEIKSPQALESVLTGKEIYDFQLMAHPDETNKSLTDTILEQKQKINHLPRIKKGILLIGPEGGFTLTEAAKAREWNYNPFSLGQRRLRSETAGIVASGIIMELLDNSSS
ncbi:RsmE family RNA methyltransferase [candidate division KSB1 bacterium]|nr:RsmE family RNA methyltransferase [candidate division KSB1 bacterium]